MREAECYRIVDARAGLGDAVMRRCERCGAPGPLTHHHRVKRSHGGGHAPSNVVLLCGSGTGTADQCHPWVESNPDAAEAEGWVIKHGGDPREVSVFHHPMQMRVRLDDDGMLIPAQG